MKYNGLSLDGMLWWIERHATELSVNCKENVWTVTAETIEHGTVTGTGGMYEAANHVFETILPEVEKEAEKNKVRDLFASVFPSLVDGSLQEEADEALEDELDSEDVAESA